jgi:hypothetical protein
MEMNRKISCAALLIAVLSMAQPIAAAPLIVNGGFELGFAGWTKADAFLPFGDGSFFLQTGTTSPVNLFSVPAPPEGTTAAMTDAEGPGAHVLYQDFMVPATVSTATLMFDWFVNNQDTAFRTPNTLAFDTPTLNQQARVDILRAAADPFSLSASDLLLNVFRTNPGSPLVSGYNLFSADIAGLLAANAGSTLRLRFAETDNVSTFNFGVDNVSLSVNAQEVPIREPATLLLIGSGLAACAARRRKKV